MHRRSYNSLDTNIRIFFLDIEKILRYLEKSREFPETYLGDFSWYLYLGLSCKVSFLFAPRYQSTLESLLTGYFLTSEFACF